jgi:hypothetical protein
VGRCGYRTDWGETKRSLSRVPGVLGGRWILRKESNEGRRGGKKSWGKSAMLFGAARRSTTRLRSTTKYMSEDFKELNY